MTIYATFNPIGSTNPKDLIDNAQNIDYLILGPLLTYPDRRGVNRLSWAGIEAAFAAAQAARASEYAADKSYRDTTYTADKNARDTLYTADKAYRDTTFTADQAYRVTQFNAFLASSGYETPVDYAPGILITRTTQIVRYSGELYRPKSASLPFTTTTFPADTAKWIANGDNSLRQDVGSIIDPAKGAEVVGFLPAGTGAVGRTVRDKLLDIVSVLDYMTPNQRNNVRAGLGTMDVAAAVSAAIDAANHIVFPPGAYQIGNDIATASSVFKSGISNKTLIGNGAKLVKKGSTGIFSFSSCTDIKIRGFEFDGNLVADEAANGSILDGSRLAANYAFAVSFNNCTRCSVEESYAHDFAWDGFVSQGTVAVGGATATRTQGTRFAYNRISNIRGTMIWGKALQDFKFIGNYGVNDDTFNQKGNYVYAVEWCDKGLIADNQGRNIGDNGIGIGELLNNVAAAVNTGITVINNQLTVTRYHAILIAQARGCLVSGNVIEQAGAKTNMPGSSSAVVCGGITVIGGTDGVTNAPPNYDVQVVDNTIIDPFEFGIYAFDRATTTLANSSDRITIARNTITGAGRLAMAGRLASGGIKTQIRKPVMVNNNRLDNITGDGIQVFGDALVRDNTVNNFSGVGINIPSDTIFGNTKLAGALNGNVCTNGKRSGIIVANRSFVSLANNACRACGIDTVPGTQDASTVFQYAGIGLYQIDDAVLHANECSDNGSSGFALRPSSTSQNRVYATNNNFSNNGSVFTVDNLRSGAYLEGNATNAVKATFINTGGTAGASQRYPIRILFGGTSTSVDGRFDTHPLAMVGATAKYTNLMTHVGRGSTGARPVLTVADIGAMYMDTTLNAGGKPIWWNGGGWVDNTGAAV
jgi:hypothetical protein